MMNGYRKMMIDQGGNLGWCRPYEAENGRVKFAINEGKICSLLIDGEEANVDSDTLQQAARIVSDYYDDYDGYTDTEIIMRGNIKECACHECPWFDVCAAMDNPDDWADPDYPDD